MIGVNSGEDSLLDYGGGLAKAKAGAKSADLAKVRKLYGPGTDDELALRYLLRDGVGTAPARWVARKWSERAPAYLYRFDHVDEAARGKRARAAHGAEVFYVFDTLGRQPADPVVPTAGDMRLAAEMHARWVAFARTGKPDIPGAPHWPAYSAAADPWMVFGPDRSGVQAHVLKTQLDWHERRTTPLIWLIRGQAELRRLVGR
jgi:para-nitrobenzyl esterase